MSSSEKALKIKPSKLKKLLPESIVTELPYSPNRPAHRDLILNHIDEQVKNVELDERLQLRKHLLFVICTLTNLIGVLLALIGLAITPLFNRYKPNPTLFWGSFAMYLPCLIYIKIILFPHGKESILRKYIVRARRWRQYVKQEQRKVFLDKADQDDDDDEEKSIRSFMGIKKKQMNDSRRGSMSASGKQQSKKAPTTTRSSVEMNPQSILITNKSTGNMDRTMDRGASSKRISFQV